MIQYSQYRIARGLRPKGADIDKPEGFIKRNLRRWWRREIARRTHSEVQRDEPLVYLDHRKWSTIT